MTRYQSLDVLRGLTVALMIIVNTPGDWRTNFSPLSHASWHGLTITDLVFPTFLFVVGNAMSFSLRKLKARGPRIYFKKVGKRTLFIFGIGLLLTAFPFFSMSETGIIPYDFSKIRLLGVLQRIALCYGIAATLVYFFTLRTSLIIGGIMLMAYWFVMYLFGAAGPDPYVLEGNAARKLDLWLIGAANLYKGEGIPFDPEGILSTLPAVVNVLLGYGVGVYIQNEKSRGRTVSRLFLLGLALLLAGYFWDLWFPVNKKIWTSTFVLVTAGYATAILAGLMYVLEIKQRKKWSGFFELFGRNPLILYVLSGLLVRLMIMIRVGDQALKTWLYQTAFVPYFPAKTASLLFALSFMLVIWLIGLWMDKNKWYIKV
ncbi:Predicted acyltransferase [Cyclobacterium lianum]|uniref:Predicted acyltransferase n=1 Tax=Cyclobacterium lianum TaxID=388280 RepID=A0A1M7PW03_9BACT|nr:heparan-alpha-glucosaminide N-acetyltransferase domain-containing protein [Cyclobacterium lianum]SHN21789.1 Predicted acyltransferase [Cyclobacterium lianum]